MTKLKSLNFWPSSHLLTFLMSHTSPVTHTHVLHRILVTGCMTCVCVRERKCVRTHVDGHFTFSESVHQNVNTSFICWMPTLLLPGKSFHRDTKELKSAWKYVLSHSIHSVLMGCCFIKWSDSQGIGSYAQKLKRT